MAADRTAGLRRRTLLGRLAATGAVAQAGCVGDGLDVGSDGEDEHLEVEWTAGRATDYEDNHHEMAGAAIDGTPVVAAPINDLDGSDRCGIVAVDGTGERAWDDRRPTEHCTPHGVGDVAVGELTAPGRPEFLQATETGEVFAYDAATGERTFGRALLDSIGYSAPAVAASGGERRLVVVDFGGTVVVARPDGTVDWRRALGGSVLRDPIVGDLDGDGAPEIAVCRRRPHRVVCLGIDGEVRWETVLQEEDRSWTVVEGDDTPGLAIATRTGGVRMLDAADGEQRWSASVGRRPRIGAAAPGRDGVSVADRSGDLSAFDVADGTEHWTRRIADDVKLAAPAAGTVDGTPVVGVGGGDGTVALCAADSGAVLARHRLDAPTWVPPVFVDTGDGDDATFVLSGDGRVSRLSYTG